MSEIIHVRHAAPIRHVPKGRRKEYLEHVTLDTPVTLREGEAAQFEPLAELSSMNFSHDLFRYEDRLWMRLTGFFAQEPGQPRQDNGPNPHVRRTFLRILQGDLAIGADYQTDIGRYLTRTPVIGVAAFQPTKGTQAFSASRTMIEDGRDQAQENVRRFLAENVALVGNDVFVRCQGPLAFHGFGRRAGLGHFGLNPFPGYGRSIQYMRHSGEHIWEEVQGYPIRPDRIRDAWDWERRNHYGTALDGRDPRFYAGWLDIPSDLLRDDDLHLMANVLPDVLLSEMDFWLKYVDFPHQADAVRDVVESLRSAAAWGSVGSVSEAETEGVLTQVRLAVEAFQANSHILKRTNRLNVMGTWLDEVALPRARKFQPDMATDEDMDAVSGLGNGP